MKTISLSKGQVAFVDDEDFEILSSMKWHLCFGAARKQYAAHSIFLGKDNVKTALMHRVILNAPPERHVDHIDGNGLNNQKQNLRLCNRSENMCNQKVRKDSEAGIRGVRFHKRIKRWQARIQVLGKSKHLGYFDTPELAAAAYKKAALILHGEFAKPSL